MGVDLDVLFAATVTAEEAFALPARLNSSPAVVSACLAYARRRVDPEEHRWAWNDAWPPIMGPSSIVDAWGNPHLGSMPLSSAAGLLWLRPEQITISTGPKLAGFAADYEGCQAPIRRLCRALAHELGTDRVVYLPDSGDWPPEVGDLYDIRFDEALARLTAWGPPVSPIGALGYGNAVRNGYHYADGALRRADGTALSEAEIIPGLGRIWSGGVTTYYDGTPVPPEELARPDLRGGFAYYIDDFRDLE